MNSPAIIVKKDVMKLSGWPTDVVSLDFDSVGSNGKEGDVHTYILFVPGNPGLVGWYIPALKYILRQVGQGYAVRGLSHAGHGVTKEVVGVETQEFAENPQANVQIPWTVNGQVEHTIAWVDAILETQSEPKKQLMFIAHSIGCHLVHRLLLLRPDLRHRTSLLMHWMPFIRMDAPTFIQKQLDFVASHPRLFIRMFKFILKHMTKEHADALMKKSVPDEEGRKLSVDLVQNPTFVRNFFELGTEEVRSLPQWTDVSSLRILLESCPIAILYCNNDQWFPTKHASDLKQLKDILTPRYFSIELEHAPNLVHDFIVRPQMVPTAVNFCTKAIQRAEEMLRRERRKSKL